MPNVTLSKRSANATCAHELVFSVNLLCTDYLRCHFGVSMEAKWFCFRYYK